MAYDICGQGPRFKWLLQSVFHVEWELGQSHRMLYRAFHYSTPSNFYIISSAPRTEEYVSKHSTKRRTLPFPGFWHFDKNHESRFLDPRGLHHNAGLTCCRGACSFSGAIGDRKNRDIILAPVPVTAFYNGRSSPTVIGAFPRAISEAITASAIGGIHRAISCAEYGACRFDVA